LIFLLGRKLNPIGWGHRKGVHKPWRVGEEKKASREAFLRCGKEGKKN